MKFNLIILLSLAVLLSIFLPAIEAAVHRPAPRRGKASARRPVAPRRMDPRRGRQEDPMAPPPVEDGAADAASDIPTWCNPADPMGAWLLFKVCKPKAILFEIEL